MKKKKKQTKKMKKKNDTKNKRNRKKKTNDSYHRDPAFAENPDVFFRHVDSGDQKDHDPVGNAGPKDPVKREEKIVNMRLKKISNCQ